MCSLSSFALVIFVLASISSVNSLADECPRRYPNGSTSFGPDTNYENTKDDLYTEFDDQGLGAFYDLVLSFINTVQSDPLPIDLIEKYVKDGVPKGGFSAIWDQWQSFELPVLITAGIGILFMLVLPVVGCCFCCCRCCGNCGGEMMQKKASNTPCKRTSFTACLFIVFVFMLVSIIIVFFCNERVSTSVTNAHTFSNDALTTSVKFIEGIQKDIEKVTSTDFDSALKVIDDKLSDKGIREGLADKLLSDLKTSVEAPVLAMQNLSTDVVKLRNALGVMVNCTKALKELSATLNSNLSQAKSDIDNNLAMCSASANQSDRAACSKIDTRELTAEANFSSLEDVSTQLKEMDDILDLNFVDKAQEGLNQFNDIASKIVNESRSGRNDVRDTLNKIKQDVGNYTVNSDKMFGNITDKMKTLRTDMDKIFNDYVLPYDQYRWYSGVASTCILLLVVVLVGMGMMCGIIGYDREAMPTTRSSVSNTGGNALMTAACFLFIIAAGSMFGVSLGFLLGFHYQKFCDPIVDDQILTWISNGRFGEIKISGNFTLDIKKLVDGCRDNKAIFTAGGFDNFEDLNLKEKFNVTELVGPDYEKQINNLNVNVTDTNILPDDARNSLNKLKNGSVNEIDFDQFINVTNEAIVSANLNTFADTLEALAANLVNKTVASAFNNSAANLRKISSTTVESMKNKSDELGSYVGSISSLGSQLNITASDVLAKVEAAEAYIKNNVSADVKKATKAYGDSLLNCVQSFVDYVIEQMEKKLGRCKPLGDVYDGLVVMLCKEFTYPLNGWWFAVGWCMFFAVPCIIFSVKLAKHYRRMKYEEGFDEEMGSEAFQMTGVGQENKVWKQNGYGYPDAPY